MSKHDKTDTPKQTANVLVFDESGVKTKVHISSASNVQIGNGNVMVVHHRKRPTTTSKTKHRQEPSITGCSEAITDEDSESVEQYLGRYWPTVARKLGFEDGEIDVIKDDNQGNLKEQIHQMLRQWRTKEEANATVGSLAKAIFSVPERDSVLRYLERNHSNGGAKPS